MSRMISNSSNSTMKIIFRKDELQSMMVCDLKMILKGRGYSSFDDCWEKGDFIAKILDQWDGRYPSPSQPELAAVEEKVCVCM